MKLTKFETVVLIAGVVVATLLFFKIPKATDGIKVMEGANK